MAQDAAPDAALIQERQAQVADMLARIPNRLSEFDYVEFGLSGPVVNLRGFSIQPSVKKEAESQVRKLDWVTHVVNEIEFIPKPVFVGPDGTILAVGDVLRDDGLEAVLEQHLGPRPE